MKYLFFISFLCLLISDGAFAQQYKSTFPYRMVSGKMIVDVYVNGKEQAFIFDTGGRTGITKEFAEEHSLRTTDSLEVIDVNSQKAFYHLTTLESLMFEDKAINLARVPALLIPDASSFVCFDAVGIIGSEILQNFIMELNGREMQITLTSAEKQSTASLRRMVNFAEDGQMPLISIQCGIGNNIKVLFDTGYAGFLNLKESDHDRLQQTNAFNLADKGISIGSIGVGGMAETSQIKRLHFPELVVCGVKFKNVYSQTSNPPYTLLGAKLLEYGKVTIDYARKRFYFEAFTAENDLHEDFNKLSFRVNNGELEVAAVWGELVNKIKVGDKVTKINGKSVRKYDFCESITIGIPELKEKNKTKVTIQTENGLETVELTGKKK